MKKFSSEFGHNYDTYSFGYTNYCLREPADKFADIYHNGYLPYSGSLGIKNVFYMARSARVPLISLELSSENRRVAKKFDGHFQREVTPVKKFEINPTFLSFCTDYFAKRHGQKVMPRERLQTILNAGLTTDIITYRSDNKPKAYVLEISDPILSHFWYSFYDLSLVHQSLGMWLMLDCACHAKAAGKKYFYVGTVYGQKALYKTAFRNIEFWDGKHWIPNLKRIKNLGRNDNERLTNLTDLWKKEELKLF